MRDKDIHGQDDSTCACDHKLTNAFATLPKLYVHKSEIYSFHWPRLKRLILLGVEVMGEWACYDCCDALTYIECDKLERVGEGAFAWCFSLRGIDVPAKLWMK